MAELTSPALLGLLQLELMLLLALRQKGSYLPLSV